MNQEVSLVKVSHSTNVGNLAKSLLKTYNENPANELVVRTVGAGAMNQAVKAIVILNENLVKSGKLATILPTYASFQNSFGVATVAIELKLRINNV